MKGPKHPERSFGLSVGGVMTLAAAYVAWRGRVPMASVVGGVGVLLVVLALVSPRLLKWPSAVWWRFAMALGYVNARVILTVVFALVLAPLGLLWRLIGRDPLARGAGAWKGWSDYPRRYRDRTHYTRMY